jgi:phosphatidylserine synthase 2
MLINPTEEVRKEENRLYKEFTKIDPFTGWFYKPHTISILLITVMILVYLAFTQHSTNSGFEINTKYGLFTSCLIFLLFSSVEMRDGLFVRPHPVIWRVIKGIAVIYLLVIVFLLFQTVDDARLLLKKIDPTLGVPLPERSYAENCTIYTPNDYHPFRYVYEALHDEFVFAHLFGWFGKAILLRDFYISWFLSISFELLEMSFEHMLPNFAECWWDHIILDILVCNGIGIYLGLKVSHLFSFRVLIIYFIIKK